MTAPLDRNSETGAILPLFAILIVILFVFAAFAVDLGAAWAERREAQTAADAGVMGAALEFLVAPPDEDGIYDLVSTYVNANVDGSGFTFDDWDSCADPDRPSGYAPLGDSGAWDSPENGLSFDNIDCISVKQAGAEPAILRVRLPIQDMPTAFARIIGINTIDVTAFAEAEILINESSDILPFSLPANPVDNECLGTPPSGQLPPDVAPCTGPASGNFGMLNIWWFGASNDTHDTLGSGCPSKPPFGTRTPYNLSVGIDHPISTWPNTDDDEITYDGPAVGVNQPNNHPGAESCDSFANDVVPYVIQTNTGNTVSELEEGFFGSGGYGTQNLPGRLRQTSPTLPAVPSVPNLPISTVADRITFQENTGSYTVDNIGLWEYLDFPSIHNASECHRDAFEDAGGVDLVGRALTDQMQLCLAESSPKAPLFRDEILDSPRFAVVPRLNYATGAQAGTQWWAIMEMVPIYLQTTWFECKSPTKDCLFAPTDFDIYGVPDGTSVFFNPGEGDTPPCLPKSGSCSTPNAISAMGVSAFVIGSGSLSETAKNSLGKPQPYEVYLRR